MTITWMNLCFYFRADKIPASLFASYEKGCKKIAQQLLDGKIVIFAKENFVKMSYIEPYFKKCFCQMRIFKMFKVDRFSTFKCFTLANVTRN